MSEHRVSLRVNGELHELHLPARFTLADALRERLDLVGTHVGCEQGICGSCTVLIDGEASRSCTVLAVSIDGADIRTVEGLSQNGELTPTQQAFTDAHALQCGFCTPGYLMTLEALLSAPQRPSRDEMLNALSGVVCRCTGYVNVLKAAEAAINARYGEAS